MSTLATIGLVADFGDYIIVAGNGDNSSPNLATTVWTGLRLRRFKSDRNEIWQDCSSCKHATIDGVGILIWRHTFKVAAMT